MVLLSTFYTNMHGLNLVDGSLTRQLINLLMDSDREFEPRQRQFDKNNWLIPLEDSDGGFKPCKLQFDD